MKTYVVSFKVDGKPQGSITVIAENSSRVKEAAQGELGGRAGYAGKKIVITSVREI